ncbi:MAG: hypothetical protein DI527_13000 [Chelatococcus sp.]|nr:MAG: hypothetical protein DI527_13000 [Chelatococcus sp.]
MASVSDVGAARLERVARLAGESFGHEDMAPISRLENGRVSTRLLWGAVALLALMGLFALQYAH